jgi:sugar phosphate permease
MVKPLLLAAVKPVLRAAGGAAVLGYESALIAAKAAPASDESSISTRQIVLFVLTYLAYVAVYFARKPVSVVKSTLQSEMGLSLAALGGIDTAMLTMYAVGQFMTGSIVAMFGRAIPLIFGFLACGGLTAAFGFVSEAKHMSFLWGLVGIFAASVNPLLVLFVADLFPASMRATAVGLWQTSQQVGGVAANTVASAVLASKGWRAVFKVSGATVATFAPVLAFALLSSSKPKAAPAAASKAKPKAATPVKAASSISPLTLPGLKSVGAAYTLVKMSRYCLMFWLPYFLTKHVGLSSASAGTMAAIFDVAGVLGSIATGFLCDGVFGGHMIATVFPFLAATAAAFGGWGAVCVAEKVSGKSLKSLHIAAMALVGFTIAGPDSVLGGAASRNLCDYAGRSSDTALAAAASGLVNGFGSVGAILQGGLTAKLVDAVGWSGLFLTLAAAMALAAGATLPAIMVEASAKKAAAGQKARA